MENHDSMLLGWYPSTPAYPPVDLPPGPQGPSTSNIVRLPPGDYPDLRTPIIHPHEPGDPTPATTAASVTTVHQSVSCAPSGERVMASTAHTVHLSHIVQPHVTQVTHLNAQLAQPQMLQQMVTSAGVTSGGHTLVQMVGVPASSVAGNVNLPIGGTLQTAQGSLIHVIEAPIDGPPFRCTECDHVAKTKRMLKRHLATVHSQERNYACQYCDAKYKSRSGLRVHSIKHNVGKHKCEHCDKLFPYKGALEEHMKVVHEDFRFKCTWEGCEFTTTSKYLLKGHVNYNHEGGKYIDNKFRKKCRFCEYVGYDIRAHESAIHGLAPRFQCPTCGKKFHFGSNLRQHKKVHLPLDQYPFVCEVCGDRFLRRRQLEDHFIGKHTNEKPHLCVKCGFSCASRRTMSDHVAANCYEKEAAFRCKFCSFETKIPFTMRTHKEKCHSKNQTKRKKQRKVWQSDSEDCAEEDDMEFVNGTGDSSATGVARKLPRGRKRKGDPSGAAAAATAANTESYMPWSVRPDGALGSDDEGMSAAEPGVEDTSTTTRNLDEGLKSLSSGAAPVKKRGRPPRSQTKKPVKAQSKRKTPKKRTSRKRKKSTSEEDDDDVEEEPEMSDIDEDELEDEEDEIAEAKLLDQLQKNDSEETERKRKKKKDEHVGLREEEKEELQQVNVGGLRTEQNANVESKVEKRSRPPKRKAAIAALERADEASQEEFYDEPPMVPVSRKPAKKRVMVDAAAVVVQEEEGGEEDELDIVLDDGDCGDDMMVMNCVQCNTFFVDAEKFREHMSREHQFEMFVSTD